jgi:hypothetical protein
VARGLTRQGRGFPTARLGADTGRPSPCCSRNREQGRLLNCRCRPAGPAWRPLRGQGPFSSLVGAALLGQGDPFLLAFPSEGTFEFGKRTHGGEQEVAMGESSPVKTRLSSVNSTRPPLRGRRWTNARRSSRLRARRSVLCLPTVSPSRANRNLFLGAPKPRGASSRPGHSFART